MGCHRSSSPVVMRADGRDGPCLHGLGQGGVQSCGVRACARCRGTGAYGRHAQHPVWWWEPPRARAVTLLDGVVRAERSDVRARRCSPAAALPALMAACVALAGCSGGSGASPASSGAPSITAPSSVGQAPDASSAPPHQQAQALTASVAPFRLPAMLSRAVAYPAGTRLLVATGLHDGERSTGAVLDVDVPGNHVTVAGRLPQAVHDAAGATLGGSPTTFGGGAATEVATIQQYVPAQRRPTAIEF